MPPKRESRAKRLEDRTRWRTNLQERLPELFQTPLVQGHIDWRRAEREYATQKGAREAEWERLVRSEAAALRENRASPRLLRGVAWAYLGTLNEYSLAPDPGNWFRDPVLIETVLAGLRGVPDRQDVPEVAEVLRLDAESRPHDLSLPFLAGLEAIERDDPARLRTLDDTQRRIALALYYTVPTGRRERPPWFRELLRSHPDLVAEILVRYQKQEIDAGSEVVGELQSLVTDRDHAGVARRAALPLLRGFPLRGRGTQLRVLDNLLWAGLRHADRTELGTVVARKIGSKSMTAAQRAHWMAAGLVAAPERYRTRFEEFTCGRDEATREAVRFLCRDWNGSVPDDDTDPATLSLLVRRIGAMFAPDEEWKDRREDLPARAAARTREFIEALGGQPSGAAGEALESLLADPTLADWNRPLALAGDRQQVASRDAAYLHPSGESVRRDAAWGPSGQCGGPAGAGCRPPGRLRRRATRR